MQLDWYLTDWTQTTNTIDYAIKEVVAEGQKTKITLERKGIMPMPIDLYVTTGDTKESHYIPLRMMRAEKTNPTPDITRTQQEDWPWTHPTYTFIIDTPLSNIDEIMIDPSRLMADIDQENNTWKK